MEIHFPHLSPSSIKQYYQCPRITLYRQAKAPKKPSIPDYWKFGEAAHEFMEKYYDKEQWKQGTEDEMIEALSAVATERTKDRVHPVAKNFFFWDAHSGPEKEDEVLLEEKMWFKIADDLPPLFGYIDYMNVTKGHLADYKTGKDDSFFRYGKPFPFGEYVQALAYREWQFHKGRDVKKMEFAFLLTGRTGLVPLDVRRDWIEDVMRNMMIQVERDEWGCSPGPLCPWCDYEAICEVR